MQFIFSPKGKKKTVNLTLTRERSQNHSVLSEWEGCSVGLSRSGPAARQLQHLSAPLRDAHAIPCSVPWVW